MNAEAIRRMAENCESAARRLATSERIGDQLDAAAFTAAAAIHRADAEKAQKAEAAARATYWWQHRE